MFLTIYKKMSHTDKLKQIGGAMMMCFALAVFLYGSTGTIPAQADQNTPLQKPFVVVAFGDSLTAGYQLGPDEGFVPQLQKALRAKGYMQVEVRNAGVSGDTTSGGLSRLDWSVGSETDAVILELGANDALRGIDPMLTRQNLEQMIRTLQARHIRVLLVGMLSPPNMGADYSKSFNPIYPDLAREFDLDLYPFFLEGVAAHPALTLPDGMHPNAKGIAVMVEGIMPKIENLILPLGN
ncbi:MAG: arylesterase [Parvibaculaceae bacterium]